MVSKTVIWNSEGNLHMRPAGLFSEQMGRYESSVRLRYGEVRADGKSMMNLLAAGIPSRAQVEVECSGPDDEAALACAARLLEEELGE